MEGAQAVGDSALYHALLMAGKMVRRSAAYAREVVAWWYSQAPARKGRWPWRGAWGGAAVVVAKEEKEVGLLSLVLQHEGGCLRSAGGSLGRLTKVWLWWCRFRRISSEGMDIQGKWV